MRVVMLASEAHPYAKTGGLGDVLGALPPALVRAGVRVTVCLPGYRVARRAAGRIVPETRVLAPVASRMEPVDVVRIADAAVPTMLLDADRYFDRDELYGGAGGDYPDNAERYAVFCRAALEWLRAAGPVPDVLHVHDWHAALAPAFLRATSALYPELTEMRTVITVHNLAYQGRFPASDWHLLNLDLRYFSSEFLEFYGGINYLKAGLVFADAITTVSPRYADEIQTPELGEGLDGVIRARRAHVRGILNGIDEVQWNPATDRHLAAGYAVGDLRGKRRCKAALQAELGLETRDEPALLAVVSRLAEQKGIDLLVGALPELLERFPVQVVVLGSGDERYEAQLRDLAGAFRGRVGLRVGFDEGLAHRIEAGADLLLMPSRFEPCGLNQLYSLRYGTVPVVRATGGLDDTVVEFDPETGVGTGFKFEPYTVAALVAATRRALVVRERPAAWARVIANGMAQDYSWDRAAREYLRLYDELMAASP